jgi:hypothetical protein
MKKKMRPLVLALLTSVLALAAASVFATPSAPDSKRMERAKEFIADEQWARAITELRAAVDDPKEPNKDAALFWLAHSEHQAGDDSSAIQTIARLEKAYATSLWVRPAGSLRVEILQRLRRDDILWRMIAPPPPAPATTPPPATPAVPLTRVRPGTPRPVAAAPPAPPAQPGPPALLPTPAPPAAVPMTPPRPGRTPSPTPPAPPAPPTPFMEFWIPSTRVVAGSVQIEVLQSLLEGHEDRVIPLLREIALDGNRPDDARRAIIVLGQSRRPEAHNTVVEVARRGADPVRVAAIRELGRFEGPAISTELMQVYSVGGTPQVKRQVVTSLGERADAPSLLRIVNSEQEQTLRDYAIVTLGRTGAREPLHTLYRRAPVGSQPAVLRALFIAKDDDELIRIAQSERNPILRTRARQTLQMLATPKALKFLEDNP